MKRLKRSILCILTLLVAAFCLCFGVACDEEEFSYEGGTSNTEYVQIYNLNTSNTPVQMAIVGGRFTFRAPTRAGLEFQGLFDAAGLMIVDANGNCLIEVQNGLQLYARWEKMTCTIYFDAGEDGTLEEGEASQTLAYESDLSNFPTPTPVAGKVFVCWVNGETPVTDADGEVLEAKNKLTSENFTFTDGSKVNLVARYEVQTFTYTFDYQDENYENKTGVVEYGATFAALKTEFPALVDTGSRELVGWSLNSYVMEEITESEAVLDDVTLYAIWKDYKTFYFYEDEGVAPTPVKIYQGNNELYQPKQKNGYEFIGWYDNNYFGGNKVQSINYYSSVETYWARWSMETYTLTFESNGGGSFEAIEYTIEDYKQLPTPEKENFTFVGWCMEEDLSDTPRTAITIGSYGGGKMYAKYKGIDRTAKLQTNGGTLAQEQAIVEYGAKYTLSVPTFEGFAFAGWFDGDGDNAKKLTDSKGVSYGIWEYLDEETTLYAKYTKKYYIHIEYRDNNGLSTSVGATAQVEEYYVSGEPAKFTVTVEEGYRYDGIYANNNLAGNPITREKEYTFNMPASDCTFFIKVYPETYSLTFDLSGGTMESTTPVMVTYGEGFTLPVPYKKAHIFKGWLYNDELCTNEQGESLSTTQITASGKVTAKFEENPAFENYVEITTAEEFLKITENTAGVYVLGKNIDLSGKSWTAVDFSGSLDGSGFTVSGLRTNLFNSVTGTVKNLKLNVNVNVTNTGNCQQIGGFAKAANGNAVIENITVYGSIHTEGNYDCGGVIGGTSDGSPIIRNCKNYAMVTSVNNGNQTGGVIGALHVIGAEIYGCENYGAVSGKNAAGVCAWIKSAMTFKECINEGSVTGTELAGGIVAYLGGTATINACGSYGTVMLNETAGGKYVGQNNVSYVNLKPIYIKEASELVWLSNCIAQEVFVLENDIDMSGVNWTPVNFAATLDGAGHKIKNLNVSSASGDLGFFLKLTGTVRNLKFENVNVESTCETNVRVGALAAVVGANGLVQKVEVLSGVVKAVAADLGGIVGCMDGNGTVEGCKNYASVSSSAVTDASGNTGGVVGYITDGTIRDCENFGTVRGQYRVGGVIGGLYIGGTRAFNNLVNHAAVTGSANCVGGVIGRWGAAYHLDLTATWKNEGAVTGVNYVGGVIGQVYNSLGDRYTTYTTKLGGYANSGIVSGSQYVGGVFGYVYGYNTNDAYMNVYISSVKNTANVTGTSEVGGIVGYVYAETSGSTLSGVSSGKITAEWKVGGIVGWADNITLTDCSNAGVSVSATKPSMDNSGIYYAYLGGYAGRAVAIKNCNNASDVVCTAGGRFVGGVAGYATGDVQNCSNTGAITAESSDYVGGIAGNMSVGWSRTYSKLSNSGNVTGLSHTGGIFGEIYNSCSDRYNTYTMTFQNLQNSGDITNVNGDYAGGLIGYLYAVNTSDSGLKIVGSELKNTGKVSGRQYVGGFVGYGYAESESQLSGESSGEITAVEGYVGGLAGRLQNVGLVDCSNEGSLVKVNKYILSGTSYYAYLGGYVGYGYKLINCHNSEDIIHLEKGDYVGGLAGRIDGLQVENCSNHGAVTAAKSAYVGGLVGYAYTTYGRTYQALNNTGDVTGTEQVGGIFGRLHDEFSDRYTTYTLTLQDLKNSGKITGSEHAIGGLIGYLYAYNSSDSGAKIVGTELKNTGAVTGKSYVGGFIGDGYAEWTDSQLTGESSGAITAEYMVGGLAGRLRNIQLISCSNLGSTVTATKYELITGSTPTYNVYLGGYVGYGYRIVGCDNATEITYTEKGNYVGGIAGHATSEIQNCSNTAAITATKSAYVGGLVGRVAFGGGPTLSGLENSGAVSGASHVGGLFGEVHNTFSDRYTTYTMSLKTIKNSGAVTGTGDYVGGIVGYMYDYNSNDSGAIISAMECTNTANVCTSGAYVGGLFGYTWSESSSILLESSSSGAISGAYYVGGLAGYAGNIVMQDCSNKGATVEATGAYYNTSNQSYYTWLGGYAGFGYGFIGCENETAITYEKSGKYVGGIAGLVGNSSLQSCTNKANIYAPKVTYVGGIAGGTERSSSITYTALENSGNVTGDSHVGGMIGYVYFVVNDRYSTHTIAMTEMTNTGAVTGKNQVGGIAGYLYAHNTNNGGAYASMAELKNSGAITGTTETGAYFGKFWTESASTMVDSLNSGAITVNGVVSPETLVGANTNLTIVAN